jgi:hypothetical protein
MGPPTADLEFKLTFLAIALGVDIVAYVVPPISRTEFLKKTESGYAHDSCDNGSRNVMLLMFLGVFESWSLWGRVIKI